MSEQALSEAAGGTPMPEAETEQVDEVVTAQDGAEDVSHDDTDAGGDDDSAFEAEARAMGWVPESEWKGEKKPRKFYSAREFVERGETILPIVNAENKRLKAELEAVRKENEERFSRMERMNQKALERQREKIISEYEARKREAVKLGDEEGYDAAEAAKRKALTELEVEQDAPEPSETRKGALSPAEAAAFSQWQESNSWFGRDDDLTGAMDIAFAKASKAMSAASFAERLEAAREMVSGLYPEKFGKRQERRSAVESGARSPVSGARGKKFADLPSEAKQAAQRFVEQGIYENVEEYAKDYWKDEEK